MRRSMLLWWEQGEIASSFVVCLFVIIYSLSQFPLHFLPFSFTDTPTLSPRLAFGFLKCFFMCKFKRFLKNPGGWKSTYCYSTLLCCSHQMQSEFSHEFVCGVICVCSRLNTTCKYYSICLQWVAVSSHTSAELIWLTTAVWTQNKQTLLWFNCNKWIKRIPK